MANPVLIAPMVERVRSRFGLPLEMPPMGVMSAFRDSVAEKFPQYKDMQIEEFVDKKTREYLAKYPGDAGDSLRTTAPPAITAPADHGAIIAANTQTKWHDLTDPTYRTKDEEEAPPIEPMQMVLMDATSGTSYSQTARIVRAYKSLGKDSTELMTTLGMMQDAEESDVAGRGAFGKAYHGMEGAVFGPVSERVNRIRFIRDMLSESPDHYGLDPKTLEQMKMLAKEETHETPTNIATPRNVITNTMLTAIETWNKMPEPARDVLGTAFKDLIDPAINRTWGSFWASIIVGPQVGLDVFLNPEQYPTLTPEKLLEIADRKFSEKGTGEKLLRQGGVGMLITALANQDLRGNPIRDKAGDIVGYDKYPGVGVNDIPPGAGNKFIKHVTTIGGFDEASAYKPFRGLLVKPLSNLLDPINLILPMGIATAMKAKKNSRIFGAARYLGRNSILTRFGHPTGPWNSLEDAVPEAIRLAHLDLWNDAAPIRDAIMDEPALMNVVSTHDTDALFKEVVKSPKGKSATSGLLMDYEAAKKAGFTDEGADMTQTRGFLEGREEVGKAGFTKDQEDKSRIARWWSLEQYAGNPLLEDFRQLDRWMERAKYTPEEQSAAYKAVDELMRKGREKPVVELAKTEPPVVGALAQDAVKESGTPPVVEQGPSLPTPTPEPAPKLSEDERNAVTTAANKIKAGGDALIEQLSRPRPVVQKYSEDLPVGTNPGAPLPKMPPSQIPEGATWATGYIPIYRGVDEDGFAGLKVTSGGVYGDGIYFYTHPASARSHATGKGGVITGFVRPEDVVIKDNVAIVTDPSKVVLRGKIPIEDTTLSGEEWVARTKRALSESGNPPVASAPAVHPLQAKFEARDVGSLTEADLKVADEAGVMNPEQYADRHGDIWSKGALKGAETVAIDNSPGRNKYRVAYAIVDDGMVNASHSGGQVNREFVGATGAHQPRPWERPENQEVISRAATEGGLNEREFVDPTDAVDHGPGIVHRDGDILNGNGREQIKDAAIANGLYDKKIKPAVLAAIENPHYGFTPEQIEQAKSFAHSDIKRVLLDPIPSWGEYGKTVKAMGAGASTALDEASRAKVLASTLPRYLERLDIGDGPIYDSFFNNQSNRDVMAEFVSSIPADVRGTLFSTNAKGEMAVTAAGKEIISQAILGSVLPDPALIEGLGVEGVSSIRDGLVLSSRSLMAINKAVAEGTANAEHFNLAGGINLALELKNWQRTNKQIHKGVNKMPELNVFLRQVAMPGMGLPHDTPRNRIIAEALLSARKKQVPELLAGIESKLGTAGKDMFGVERKAEDPIADIARFINEKLGQEVGFDIQAELDNVLRQVAESKVSQ